MYKTRNHWQHTARQYIFYLFYLAAVIGCLAIYDYRLGQIEIDYQEQIHQLDKRVHATESFIGFVEGNQTNAGVN